MKNWNWSVILTGIGVIIAIVVATHTITDNMSGNFAEIKTEIKNTNEKVDIGFDNVNDRFDKSDSKVDDRFDKSDSKLENFQTKVVEGNERFNAYKESHREFHNLIANHTQ